MSPQKIDHVDEDSIRETFVGRSIVSATQNCLTLDDGTQVQLKGNNGSWGTADGNYWLDHVTAHPHIITGVALANIKNEDTARTYKLFVYSGATHTEVASFTGDDGNGWYGTGYTLKVLAPGETDDDED